MENRSNSTEVSGIYIVVNPGQKGIQFGSVPGLVKDSLVTGLL